MAKLSYNIIIITFVINPSDNIIKNVLNNIINVIYMVDMTTCISNVV